MTVFKSDIDSNAVGGNVVVDEGCEDAELSRVQRRQLSLTHWVGKRPAQGHDTDVNCFPPICWLFVCTSQNQTIKYFFALNFKNFFGGKSLIGKLLLTTTTVRNLTTHFL
ncbi:unnamed protein product [Ceratitis capitata]|uniref:(Mediterranean fruit fly) hypothetical protein n=1 Tax=Ceratitis capitata TaxID=7213 RepID=A0A811V1A2_CERCA|nr:unnamed protein product [Ceratitis capitata]